MDNLIFNQKRFEEILEKIKLNNRGFSCNFVYDNVEFEKLRNAKINFLIDDKR